MRVFVNFFFKKFLLRNFRLDFYQISQECSLEVKNFSSPLQKKSGLWSDTGAQAHLIFVKAFNVEQFKRFSFVPYTSHS